MRYYGCNNNKTVYSYTTLTQHLGFKGLGQIKYQRRILNQTNKSIEYYPNRLWMFDKVHLLFLNKHIVLLTAVSYQYYICCWLNWLL